MYINFKYLQTKGISPTDAIYLICCSQNKIDDLKEYMENWFGEYNVLSYTEQLKNGKFVLTKAGREIYENMQVPEINDDDVKIYEWLLGEARDREWDVSNKKKVLGLVAWFRTQVGLTAKELTELIDKYLQAEDSKWNKKLEYMFFKPVNMYSKRNLEESKLFNFKENNWL